MGIGDDGKPEYGLGLDYATFNNLPAIGHSGGGLGSGCQLYYIPSKNIYFFLGINIGTVTESPIFEKASPLLMSFIKPYWDLADFFMRLGR